MGVRTGYKRSTHQRFLSKQKWVVAHRCVKLCQRIINEFRKIFLTARLELWSFNIYKAQYCKKKFRQRSQCLKTFAGNYGLMCETMRNHTAMITWDDAWESASRNGTWNTRVLWRWIERQWTHTLIRWVQISAASGGKKWHLVQQTKDEEDHPGCYQLKVWGCISLYGEVTHVWRKRKALEFCREMSQ